VSLDFLSQQFKQEIDKPYRQLKSLTELWEELVPAELRAHCRLDSLSRGVLRVTVDSASCRYELDRLLREGLAKQLIVQHKGPAMRRVQVRVGTIEPEADPKRQPREGGM